MTCRGAAAARFAACAVTLLVVLPGIVHAQTAESRTIVPAIYSSDRVSRNADLAFSAAVLATSSVDEAIAAAWLDGRPRTSKLSRTARISKLVLFDVPVVTFFVGLNHEGGHIARSREKSFPYSFRIVGSPWSGQPFELYALDHRILDDLGAQAGGLEASRSLKDRSEARLWREERIAPGHALTAVIASLDLPVYALHNLAPSQFERGFPIGDPAAILSILQLRKLFAGEPYSLEPARGKMRARSLLNFADTALLTLAYGVLRDHVWNGEDGVRVRWLRIGDVQLLPSVRYELTSIGPEYHVRSHYRTAGVVGLGYVRWSEAVDDARQFGFGGSVALRRERLVSPRFDLDVWSHSRDGAGLHAAASVEITAPRSPNTRLAFSFGAKSPGYVGALPIGAGVYVSAGVVFRVW